jgi:thiamine phosphate synthase YjbQ (UPF0047 family)
MTPPSEITLTLTPRSRLDIIDVSRRIQETISDFTARYRRTLYCSHHTTAGYLDQSLAARFNYDPESLQNYVLAFQNLFPPNAGYRHDEMHLRSELTAEQRAREPRNGDSHLTFIGSGLRNCVSYVNKPDSPAYLIDLDGTNGGTKRERTTTVIGFDREEMVQKLTLTVPVSGHPVDSVNLLDPRLGVRESLTRTLDAHGIRKGRIDIHLSPEERNAGLTVNEYETLLMRHDLAEVIRNPLRFVAEKGRNMMIDPLAIPQKTINYAKYDLVQIVNTVLEKIGASNSPLERVVDKLLAVPAARFLRMKRSVNLLVSDGEDAEGRGRIVQGTYQSPILVQWDKARHRHRRLDVTVRRFV